MKYSMFTTYRRPPRRTTRIVLFLIAISAAEARAQLVDHQPHNTGGPAADTAFFDSFGREVWQRVADDFILNSDSAVQRISWWGFHDLNNAPASETMRIRVRAARASDGLPGDLVYDHIAVDPTRTATGRIVLVGHSPREYLYQLDLPTPLQIAGQTRYWLEIAQIGDPSSAFRWEFSVSDNSRHAYINPMVADWQYPQGNGDLAFQLTQVPEPISFTLFGAVAVAAVLRRANSCR